MAHVLIAFRQEAALADSERIRSLARIGAELRLANLRREIDEVLQLFPELRESSTKARASKPAAASKPARAARRQRTMTAEQRAAVSQWMRRYWASRRQAKEGSEGAAASTSASGGKRAGGRGRGVKKSAGKKGGAAARTS